MSHSISFTCGFRLSDATSFVRYYLQGVEYGRLCFENLRKSVLYLLPAGSFSELMPVLVNIFFGAFRFVFSLNTFSIDVLILSARLSIALGLPQVLSNIQMLIICCITDVLPALSLVYEKPEADLLLRKPRFVASHTPTPVISSFQLSDCSILV